jgi:hypothetical protein
VAAGEELQWRGWRNGGGVRLSPVAAGSAYASAFCRSKRSCSSSSGCCICISILRFQSSARAILGNLSPHRSTVAPTARALPLAPDPSPLPAPASFRLLRRRRRDPHHPISHPRRGRSRLLLHAPLLPKPGSSGVGEPEVSVRGRAPRSPRRRCCSTRREMRRESRHHAGEEWEQEEAPDLLPAEGGIRSPPDLLPAEVAAPAVSQNTAAVSHLAVVAPSFGSTQRPPRRGGVGMAGGAARGPYASGWRLALCASVVSGGGRDRRALLQLLRHRLLPGAPRTSPPLPLPHRPCRRRALPPRAPRGPREPTTAGGCTTGAGVLLGASMFCEMNSFSLFSSTEVFEDADACYCWRQSKGVWHRLRKKGEAVVVARADIDCCVPSSKSASHLFDRAIPCRR